MSMQSAQDLAFSADGLTKYFGSKPIVRQCSFAIPRGTVTGLLGLNGTGKSTTIRMLMGFLPPTRGSSAILGIDSQSLTASDRMRIGYTVEGHFLYSWMRVSDCERFQEGTFSRWNGKQFRNTIDRFGIDLRTRVSHLSRGQRAGVSLALTLCAAPEVLVLDDPALGLDPVSRQALNETILEFVESGDRTVLLSSHLLDDIERIADRILIMVDGRFVVDTTVENLLSRLSTCTLELDEDARSLPSIPGLVHVRRVGRRWTLTIVDMDSEAESMLSQLGGHTLVRNPTAFNDAAMAYLSRSRGSSSFLSKTPSASNSVSK
jgi:ABC-2 type transport system ATP-binding protein